MSARTCEQRGYEGSLGVRRLPPEITQEVRQTIIGDFARGLLVAPRGDRFVLLDPEEERRAAFERILRDRPPVIMTSAGLRVVDHHIHDFDGTTVPEGGHDKTGSEADKFRPETIAVAAAAYNGIERHPELAEAYIAFMRQVAVEYPGPVAYMELLNEMIAGTTPPLGLDEAPENSQQLIRNGIATGRTLGEIDYIARLIEMHGGRVDGVRAAEDGAVIAVPQEMISDGKGGCNLELLERAVFWTYLEVKGVNPDDPDAVGKAMGEFLATQNRGGWAIEPDPVNGRYIVNATDHTLEDFKPLVNELREIGRGLGHEIITSLDENNEGLANEFNRHCGHLNMEITRASLNRRSSVVILMPSNPEQYGVLYGQLEEAAGRHGIEVRRAHTDIVELHFPKDNKGIVAHFAANLAKIQYGIPGAPYVYGNHHNDVALAAAALKYGGRAVFMPNENGEPYVPVPEGARVGRYTHAFGVAYEKAQNAMMDREWAVPC